MALYSIQGETLSEIADAIREKTETEEPIQTNEMSSMIRKIEGSSPNAVLYTEQSLTDEQKAQARENIGAAAISHNHAAGDITSGTLPFERGGTGASTALVNAPVNAIIRKPTDGNYLYYTATNNGAFFATSANGLPKFGTLPIAQGGTGATSASAALSKLGGIPFQQKTIAAGSSVKIVTSSTNLLMCRLSTSSGTAGVYAITAYSESRAPAIAQLASAANVTVATGGSNDAGWYTTITAGSSGSVYLTVYGGCTIT